jgi:hypothetical protein
VNGIRIVAGKKEENPHESQDGGEAVCPSGMHAIGGGVVDSGGVEQTVNEMFIEDSSPTSKNDAFFADVNNTSKEKNDTFNVWALCATASVTGEAFAK